MSEKDTKKSKVSARVWEFICFGSTRPVVAAHADRPSDVAPNTPLCEGKSGPKTDKSIPFGSTGGTKPGGSGNSGDNSGNSGGETNSGGQSGGDGSKK